MKRLAHVSAESAFGRLDPSPQWAPVPLAYRVPAHPQLDQVADAILDALANVVLQLFPAWAPGALDLAAQGGDVGTGVRALSRRLAEEHGVHGPFHEHATLWALSERASASSSGARAFPREVRATELPNLLRLTYGRERIALLAQLPDGEAATTDSVLASSFEWLAFHGCVAVALCNADRPTFERFDQVDWPADVDEPPPTIAAPLLAPPVAGRPHPHSHAEQRLHAALCQQAWAAGAAFNHALCIGSLEQPVRVDVLWERQRVILEVDGPDHRGADKYATDRLRDNHLQLQGYRVMRFTNEHIEHDLDDVLHQIRAFLHAAGTAPGGTHGPH
ncbi:MAG: endonuclease domain-containing protein [Myxococcales bacterium]|nr:endonuclease domain-containing protein [Myxococcales bacterium]